VEEFGIGRCFLLGFGRPSRINTVGGDGAMLSCTRRTLAGGGGEIGDVGTEGFRWWDRTIH
jgi:hypothetical protein